MADTASPPQLRDTYEFCLVERRDHLLEVTINRPEAYNCFHQMLSDELDEVFDAYEADDTLWVAIITGAGTKAFSTGGDLKFLGSGKAMRLGPSGLGGLTDRVRSKPVIAAVNGFALGGGFEICLACDMIVADERAQFGLSEARVGLVAGAGGTERLIRQLPKKLAMELLLTGRNMPVAEADRHGLINAIAPAGEAMALARELAGKILACAPGSVRTTMQMINAGAAHASEAEAVIQRDQGVIGVLMKSEDTREGLATFAQKRPPVWKNR